MAQSAATRARMNDGQWKQPVYSDHSLLIGGLAVALMPILALLLPALLLPALSSVLLVSAGIASFVAWRIGGQRHGGTRALWDLAGAFAFLGCIAGSLSDPTYVVRFFEVLTAGR